MGSGGVAVPGPCDQPKSQDTGQCLLREASPKTKPGISRGPLLPTESPLPDPLFSSLDPYSLQPLRIILQSNLGQILIFHPFYPTLTGR